MGERPAVTLADALERDTFAFWEGFARRPGGESQRESGATWFRTGVPLANYNGVLGNAADVASVLERVRSWHLPARWIVNSANAADGLEHALAESGCAIAEDAPGMVAEIAGLPAPAATDMTMDVVRDAAAFDEWADVFTDAFGIPAGVAADVRAAHAWPCLHDANRTYLVMRGQEGAVATGLLHSRTGVAGVYAIGVRRALQKQGLGALATLLTVREGARRGAELAMLQATAQGVPVYQRLGFTSITSFRSWRIA